MCDKGFTVAADLFGSGAGLLQPMEKPKKKKFSSKALLYSRRVSRKRVHIERWVRRVSGRAQWLQRKVPLHMVHLIYPITQICVWMGNFRCPIR